MCGLRAGARATSSVDQGQSAFICTAYRKRGCLARFCAANRCDGKAARQAFQRASPAAAKRYSASQETAPGFIASGCTRRHTEGRGRAEAHSRTAARRRACTRVQSRRACTGACACN